MGAVSSVGVVEIIPISNGSTLGYGRGNDNPAALLAGHQLIQQEGGDDKGSHHIDCQRHFETFVGQVQLFLVNSRIVHEYAQF